MHRIYLLDSGFTSLLNFAKLRPNGLGGISMKVNKVWCVCFSPTGTTKKIVGKIAGKIADNLNVEYVFFDFTLPAARKEQLSFAKNELVVLGSPVYAGRIPNLLLKYLQSIEGNGAFAVPVVLYGNRNYDDALIELKDILLDGGFLPVAAAAFVGEHSFSTILAKDRPDSADLALADDFASKVAEKLQKESSFVPIEVKGVVKPYRGYYQPRDGEGNAIDIRKVKPLTNELCIDCKICAKVCPLGSVDYDDVRQVTGICIKCCACIKKCPKNAKYFADTDYLYHKKDLEERFTDRSVPESFL